MDNDHNHNLDTNVVESIGMSGETMSPTCSTCEAITEALRSSRPSRGDGCMAVTVDRDTGDGFVAAVRFDEPILTDDGSLLVGISDVAAPTRADALCRLITIAIKETGWRWSERFGARLVHSVLRAIEASPAPGVDDYSCDEVRGEMVIRVERRTGRRVQVPGRVGVEGFVVPWHRIDDDAAELLAHPEKLQNVVAQRKLDELRRRFGP